MTRKKERRQRARLATADRTGTMGKKARSRRALSKARLIITLPAKNVKSGARVN